MLTAFILIMLCLSCLVSGLVTFRVTLTTSWVLWQKVTLFLSLAFIFMTPPLLRCPISKFYGTACLILTYVLYFCFVCLFLFFCLMIIRDMLWFFLRYVGCPLPSPVDPHVANTNNLILTVLVVVLSCWALFEGMRVPHLKELTLTSNKVKSPITLAVLPDIHIHRALLPSKLRGLIQQTNALNPDLILLPGDIIDDQFETIKQHIPLLQNFKSTYGTFATLGNHEVYLPPSPTIYANSHITLLNNNSVQIRPDILLSGIPDVLAAQRHNPPQLDKALPHTSAFSILMAHTPKMFDMTQNSADLQVSGHTHGGQILPFHILSWFSNRYLAGLYHQDNRFLYVSRGAGQWGPQMRLFSPAEITLITIKPKQ